MSSGDAKEDPRSRHRTTDGPPDAAWLQRMAELEDRCPPISAGGFYFGIGRLAGQEDDGPQAGRTPAKKIAEPATDWPRTPTGVDMFDPNSPTYEAELAALCARVQAFVYFHCQLQARDAQAAEDAVQAALLDFTARRSDILYGALSRANGDPDTARSMVRRYVCKAAQRALWRQRDKQRRLSTDAAQDLLDGAVPPSMGAALDREAAGQMVRDELDALEGEQRDLINMVLAGMSHAEMAKQLGISENAATLRLHRLLPKLATSERLQRAFNAWQESLSGSYGSDGTGPERTEVAIADHGRVQALQLTVHDLRWGADGYLHGTFVLPPTAELRDVTHGLAQLTGRPGDDDVFAVAEPFTLLWHDGAEGRTATFATYLGPRPGNPKRSGHLPAAAVKFVLAR